MESIKKYIARTGTLRNETRYSMSFREGVSLDRYAHEHPFKAIVLAFEYGRAKGFRMGTREAKKKEAAK